jgi:hypothetical protein
MFAKSKLKKFYSTAPVWGKAAAGGGASFVTWDAATIANVTLSGGNLVVTNTGGSSGDQGARVAAGKTTGKHYFEITYTSYGGGGNTGVGIATPASTYTAMGSNATTGCEVFSSGNIYSNGGSTGQSLGTQVTGVIMGVAVDLDNRKIWFRNAPSGNWNDWTSGGATYNPATNVGGISIPSGTMAPICTFNAGGSVFTANFGASAFTGAVPSGFTAGWTV